MTDDTLQMTDDRLETVYLEEQQLRAGRDPVAVVTAVEGGLHLDLHCVLQLCGHHLGQAVVVVLKQGLLLHHLLVVLQSQGFVGAFPPKEALQGRTHMKGCRCSRAAAACMHAR